MNKFHVVAAMAEQKNWPKAKMPNPPSFEKQLHSKEQEALRLKITQCEEKAALLTHMAKELTVKLDKQISSDNMKLEFNHFMTNPCYATADQLRSVIETHLELHRDRYHSPVGEEPMKDEPN